MAVSTVMLRAEKKKNEYYIYIIYYFILYTFCSVQATSVTVYSASNAYDNLTAFPYMAAVRKNQITIQVENTYLDCKGWFALSGKMPLKFLQFRTTSVQVRATSVMLQSACSACDNFAAVGFDIYQKVWTIASTHELYI